ncbi:glycosyltransferase family 2 protein [uncultured Flavobacterium sp.]|uniref:glycosyltransferase family 2 protein n=1 Tax=uncultured Flavobacterium sp. TaxID=165435 RepID=UPI00292F2492|nr:glycosyltransferase family 2 protein [uncultured Flavobacterium sp.]
MINITHSPLISIIIPTYNRSYCLHATIKAAINQTYKNTEIIIVDDGSTDNTKNVVSAFGNKIVYIQKAHTGQADTRNVGLQYAKGEIIAPLDSDDIWHDQYLEKSIGYMLEHKLDLFFSNWEYNILNKYQANVFPYFSDIKDIPNKGCYIFGYAQFRKLLLIDSIAPSSGLVIKKSAIPFGWNVQVNIGDDWVLQLEMIFKNLNCQVGFTKEVFWKKNRDTTNISDGRKGITFRKLHIKDLHLILNKFSSYMDKHECEMIDLKIIQNKILVAYLLLLKGRMDIEIRQLFIHIVKKPNLFFIALKKGIQKQINRKNYQFTFVKN